MFRADLPVPAPPLPSTLTPPKVISPAVTVTFRVTSKLSPSVSPSESVIEVLVVSVRVALSNSKTPFVAPIKASLKPSVKRLKTSSSIALATNTPRGPAAVRLSVAVSIALPGSPTEPFSEIKERTEE